MDLEAAKVIGAGLAAIGVGAAAAGVGIVFGSFLQGALRNPAAADGQQGRLFIGFAAAELLGLMAFAVAMIILYARLIPRSGGVARREDAPCPNSTSFPTSSCRSCSGWRWCFGFIYLRDRAGDGAEDPVDRGRARSADRRRSRRGRAGARPRPTRPRKPIASGWTRAAPKR